MKKDPIVEEIHQARKKLLKECHGNLDELMDLLKQLESSHQDLIVSKDAIPKRLHDSASSAST